MQAISNTQAATNSQQPRDLSKVELEMALKIINVALEEDLSDEGDITSRSTIPPDKQAQAFLLAKESPSIVAGLKIAELVFRAVDSTIKFEALIADGSRVAQTPTKIAKISGPAISILTAERTALNLIQRMSGIATHTATYADKARPFGVAVLDTRKTAPGLRVLDKLAVRLGGGINHRFGLYDQVLIKDNHIACAGGITQAVQSARKLYSTKKIEVETTNLQEVEEALAVNADIIMLDNMTPQQVSQCVDVIQKKAFIEVSGGITLETFEKYLLPGVDAISIGALTHSVKAVDISLEVEIEQ